MATSDFHATPIFFAHPKQKIHPAQPATEDNSLAEEEQSFSLPLSCITLYSIFFGFGEGYPSILLHPAWRKKTIKSNPLIWASTSLFVWSRCVLSEWPEEFDCLNLTYKKKSWHENNVKNGGKERRSFPFGFRPYFFLVANCEFHGGYHLKR